MTPQSTPSESAHRSRPRKPASSVEPTRGIARRELLLRYGGAAAALGLGWAWLVSQATPRKSVLASGVASSNAPSDARSDVESAPRFPPDYFHGFFTVNSPEEVAQAAALGVNYTIQYGGTSFAAVDLGTTLGYAHAQYGVKVFLNLENPFLHCASGVGTLDEGGVRQIVGRFKDSPVLAGYWTKDDDCGDEGAAVLRMRNLIRSLDPDPRHRIMPGFGDAASVARNYIHGQGDLLGFYPYPGYSRGPAAELPEMLRIVRERTPPGAQPPPFIGIYQAFGHPPQRPVPTTSDVLAQARFYLANGARGLMGFGWEAELETYLPSNDPALREAIGAVSQALLAHR